MGLLRIVDWEWFGWLVSMFWSAICSLGEFVMLVWGRLFCLSTVGCLLVKVLMGAMVGVGRVRPGSYRRTTRFCVPRSIKY